MGSSLQIVVPGYGDLVEALEEPPFHRAAVEPREALAHAPS
jgi:hypothetical protein